MARAEASRTEEERLKIRAEQLKLDEEKLQLEEKKMKLAEEKLRLARDRLNLPVTGVKAEGVRKRLFEAIDVTGDGDYVFPSLQGGEIIVIEDD